MLGIHDYWLFVATGDEERADLRGAVRLDELPLSRGSPKTLRYSTPVLSP